MNKFIFTLFLITSLFVFCNSSCSSDSDLFIAEVLEEEEDLEVEEGESITEELLLEEDQVLKDASEIINSSTNGASYCGPYTVSEPLVLSGLNDTIISGLKITNPDGNAITISNCENVTIENCFLYDSSGNGVNIYSSTNVIIQNNRMESISTAVYAQVSQEIQVLYNDVKNVIGPFPRGQLAQFADCTGSDNKINYNVMENISEESYAEDAINLYNSSGTESSPIEIVGNWIRGGGPSSSGGGIMTGDNGGSYVLVKDNILVNPGQYGIAIACGTNIQIYDNLVYAEESSFSNVGIYVWNQTTSESCGSNEVYDNTVSWTNSEGNINGGWNASNCGTITGWDDNVWDADIDASILPDDILLTNCTDD